MTAGIPLAVILVAQPLLLAGENILIAMLPWIVGVAFTLMVTLIAGFRARRFWTICLFYYIGVALLASYGAALVFAAVVAAKLFPLKDSGACPVAIWGLIFTVLQFPFAWWLWGALRLRYWQPGSHPDQWEAGDETPPAWALSPNREERTKPPLPKRIP